MEDHPDAAALLIERYADRVYRLTSRILGSPEDAEEATQDTLRIAMRSLSTFGGGPAFGSLVDRIAANAAYQKLRQQRSEPGESALEDLLPPLDADGHFAPMEDWSKRIDEHGVPGELREVLAEAIDALPPDFRTALVLRDVEGLSDPDIAEALDMSLPAVKSRVHRSRLFVRQRLSGYLERSGSS